MRSRHLPIIASIVFVTTATLGQVPLGPAFIYQGRLKMGGQPFNGTATMAFSLWDAPTGGNRLGTSVVFDGSAGHPLVSVVDGLFAVELNAGGEFGPSAFIGQARWLEISVNGTPLVPRQPLDASPNATFAARPWATSGSDISYVGGNVGIGTPTPLTRLHVAGSLQLAGTAQDISVPPGENLQFGHFDGATFTERMRIDATGFVGIGRATPISAEEFLGLQAPVASGFGGMYIQTDGASAAPFYGYAAGSLASSCWTSFFGGDQAWRVYNNGIRLVVARNGNVAIGDLVPAARLHVVSTTANPAENTAMFQAATIGPNASHIHYGTTGDWYIRSAANNGKVVIQDTGGFVGVGRANSLGPAEYFGVLAPVASGYGGMYLQTTGANGAPFYGYAAAGNTAWTYFNGPSQSWIVNNGGDWLTVTRAGNVGIGTTSPSSKLHVSGSSGGIFAETTTGSGLWGQSADGAGRGVTGYATATIGTNYGIFGRSDSQDGAGVYGRAANILGGTKGVWGDSNSAAGRGVYGHATAANGTNYGVFGQSDSTSGTGVYGWASAAAGSNAYGMYGISDSTSGVGVVAVGNAGSGSNFGLYALSNSTDGVAIYGEATSTNTSAAFSRVGVRGKASGGAQHAAVEALGVSSATGLRASSQGGGPGVVCSSQTGPGLQCTSNTNYALIASGDAWVTGDLTVSGAKHGYVTDLVRNADDEPLEPGDLVEIVGSEEPMVGEIPVIRVRRAVAGHAQAVMGVVDCALDVRPVAPTAAPRADGTPWELPPAGLFRMNGPVAPGGYGWVVTLGAFRTVRLDESCGPISAGDHLTSSATPGRATRQLQPGASCGVALEDSSGDRAEVRIFVQSGWWAGVADGAERVSVSAEIARLQVRLAQLERSLSAAGRGSFSSAQ